MLKWDRYALLFGVILQPSVHSLGRLIVAYINSIVSKDESWKLQREALAQVVDYGTGLVLPALIFAAAGCPLAVDVGMVAILHMVYVLLLLTTASFGLLLVFKLFPKHPVVSRIHAETLLRMNEIDDPERSADGGGRLFYDAPGFRKYAFLTFFSMLTISKLGFSSHNVLDVFAHLNHTPIERLDLVLLVVLVMKTASSWYYWMRVDVQERRSIVARNHRDRSLSATEGIGSRSSSYAVTDNMAHPEPRHQVVPEAKSHGTQANLDLRLPLWALNQTLPVKEPRPSGEVAQLLKQEDGPSQLSDVEIFQLVASGAVRPYDLENRLKDHTRAVDIRRKLLAQKYSYTGKLLEDIPHLRYDYTLVTGACCENVIGTIPMPLGYVGPLKVNGKDIVIPLGTTEGCLVASVNRGCRAVATGAGIKAFVYGDRMTRGPVCKMPSATEAVKLKSFVEERRTFDHLKNNFDSTSRFARLKNIHVALAGRLVYIRFEAFTGDAMGMNMVSKGVEKALKWLEQKFPDMEVLSLSGNYCTDKKATALNWIKGRGKSVVCDAIIEADVVRKKLGTTVDAMVELNTSKNLVGSAMAGSVGGNNAHAANIVSAIFVATGQDIAQNISSSSCITQMERQGEDLYISCTMPCIEVGTIGGGTVLAAQKACLEMLGCSGGSMEQPGENAERLALAVCATVLAGELSLMAALSAGHLVKSHMKHNRSCAVLPRPASPARSASASGPRVEVDGPGVKFALSSSELNVTCKSL